jgi:kumamolisin
LWAGLTALLNKAIGTRLGFLNPLLYGPLQATGSLSDITTGNNGSFQAASDGIQ